MKALLSIATGLWLGLVVLHSGEARSAAVCGNGAIESPEACDDGNTTDGDACSSSCTCVRGSACYVHPDASAAGSVAIGAASIAEGDSGTKSLAFPITRTGAAGKELVLTVRSDAGSSADEATAGTDYTALGNTTVRIPSGAAGATQAVTIKGDTAIEADEQFLMHVTAARKAGAPDFVAARAFDLIGGVDSVSSGDLNGDGRPDLVVSAGPGSASYSVLVNAGAATGYSFDFTVHSFAIDGSAGSRGQFADIDGDGKLDVVFVTYAGTIEVALNTSSGSTPTFAAAVSIAASGNPEELAIADLNGDSRPEVAVRSAIPNSTSGYWQVFRNASTTGAVSLVAGDLNTMASLRGIQLGDVDGDGKRDVIVANSTAQVVIFRNNTTSAAPAFFAGTTFTTGSTPVGIALGDLDGDSRPDLVTTNLGGTSVSVLRNLMAPGSLSGTGIPSNGFAAKLDFATASLPTSVRLGDIDGDGRRDVAVTTQNGYLSLLRNASTTGSISLQARTDLRLGSSLLYGLELTDVDGDSRLDLVTGGNNQEALVLTNSALSGVLDAYSFKLQAGAGQAGCYPVVLADLDADGDRDLVCRTGSASLLVRRNVNARAGAPLDVSTFPLSATLTAGLDPRSIAVGDLDGDGKPDIVTANNNYNSGTSISVFRNTTAAGGPSFSAKADIAVGATPWDVGIADVDGDGKPDVIVTAQDSQVRLFRNVSSPGAIALTAVGPIASAPFFGLSVGDANADGKADFAVGNSGSTFVFVNGSSVGNISFQPAGASTGGDITATAIGDINGDGLADLVSASQSVSSRDVHVMLNSGSAGGQPQYSVQRAYTFGISPKAVRIADVDADGRNDIVMIASHGGVHVLRNAGIGTTLSAASFSRHGFGGSAGSGTTDIAAADLNADGVPDLVAGGETLVYLTGIVPSAVSITGSEAVGTILNDDLPAPAVAATPASLAFGSVDVGGTSASASTFTVSNTGNVALTVTGASLGGSHPNDFSADTSACGALAVGGSCTVSVSFSPSAAGTRTATLTVTTDESGVTAAVSLSGTGLQAAAALDGASLAFGSQRVGTTSGAQTLGLANAGNATLTITSISASGDFSASDDCGLTLAAGQSCTISVRASPSVTGARSGTLSVVSSAPDSPATASLGATGTAPALSVPASLDFGSRTTGSPVSATVTVSNTGSFTLAVGTPSIGGPEAGDFAITANDCGSVAVDAECSIQLSFTPGAEGARAATLSIPSDAADSPASVVLTGSGAAVAVEPPPEPSADGGGGGSGPALLALLALAAGLRRRGTRKNR